MASRLNTLEGALTSVLERARARKLLSATPPIEWQLRVFFALVYAAWECIGDQIFVPRDAVRAVVSSFIGGQRAPRGATGRNPRRPKRLHDAPSEVTVNRRDFIRKGLIGSGGLTVPAWPRTLSTSLVARARLGRAEHRLLGTARPSPRSTADPGSRRGRRRRRCRHHRSLLGARAAAQRSRQAGHRPGGARCRQWSFGSQRGIPPLLALQRMDERRQHGDDAQAPLRFDRRGDARGGGARRGCRVRNRGEARRRAADPARQPRRPARTYVETSNRLGLSIELWSEEKTRAALGIRDCAGALFDPHGSHVDPMQLTRARRRRRERGRPRLRGQPGGWGRRGGDPARAPRRGQTVRAPAAVLATNAFTTQLGFFRNAVFPAHNYMAITAPLSSEQLSRAACAATSPSPIPATTSSTRG